MKLLVLVLLLIFHIEAKVINWPFTRDLYYGNNVCYVNVSIGTPAQEFSVTVGITSWVPSLFMRNYLTDGYGFDKSASSTYKQTGVFHDVVNKTWGITGTDNVVIANHVLETEKSLAIDTTNRFYEEETGVLSFAQPIDGSTSFIQSILTEVDSPVVVFTTFSPDLNSGVITLGGRAPDRCANDWSNLPQQPISTINNFEWEVAVNEFSFGKYTFDKPGVASFHLESNEYIFVPYTYQKQIMKTLGTYDEFQAPCNSTAEFVFKFGDFELRLTPSDYLFPLYGNSEWCSLGILSKPELVSDNEFWFGFLVFKKLCLSLDYANTTVGLATRVFN
ncbi:Pepsin A-like protein [Aphelenchoides besseyi]|nr:Pepsin A-like protein [Aphelenchoides besseyi]